MVYLSEKNNNARNFLENMVDGNIYTFGVFGISAIK